MLSPQDKLAIKHCYSAGISANRLAGYFKKSKQTIMNVVHEPINWCQYSPDQSFNFGTAAERLAQKLKYESTPSTVTVQGSRLDSNFPKQLHHYRQARRLEREIKKQAKRDVLKRNLESVRTGNSSEEWQPQDEKVNEEESYDEERLDSEEETYSEEEVDDEDSYNEEDSLDEVEKPLGELLIEDMTRNLPKADKRGWRFSKRTIQFCFILSRYSHAAYSVLHQILPLPSRQTISRKCRKRLQNLIDGLGNTKKLHLVIDTYIDRAPFRSAGEVVQCCLAIDAFSINLFTGQAPCTAKTETCDFRDEVVPNVDGETCVHAEPQICAQQLAVGCNNMFIVVLVPFRWDRPHVVLSLFPARSGSANPSIVVRIFQLISLCQRYHFNVRVIATDGDAGYNCLHTPVSALWLPHRTAPFERILEIFQHLRNVKCPLRGYPAEKLNAIPIADPLHAVKVARSRVLRHPVFMAPTLRVTELDFLSFRGSRWFDDRSQIGGMCDYYALAMFSPSVVMHMIASEKYGATAYLWGWTAMMLVLRVPFLSKETRQSLLIGAFYVFVTFLNQILDGKFKHTRIKTRFVDKCEGVTFFDKKYLIRVIHLIFALYIELSSDDERLRLSAFGTHTNENIIGRARVASYGMNSCPVFLRHFAKSELSRLFEHRLRVPRVTRTRDNVGGAKLDLKEAVMLNNLDIGSDTRDFITAFIDEDNNMLQRASQKIAEFLQQVLERESEIPGIYEPNPAANAGIMSRLIHFEATEVDDVVEG